MPQHYLLITTPLQGAKRVVSPQEIWDTLAAMQVWYLTPSAPFRARLTEGDKILFYLGGKPGGGAFVGQAVCSSSAEALTSSDEELLDHYGIPFFGWRLPLANVVRWASEVQIRPLVPRLTFIKDKRNYGLHLRLSVVALPETDFRVIAECGSAMLPPMSGTGEA